MFQIRIVEKIKTYFMFCESFSENRAVYEIMPKNFVKARKDADNKAPARGILISKPTRAQANARARISTSTHTHTQKYVIIIAFQDNSDIVNAPQCYITRTLSLLY